MSNTPTPPTGPMPEPDFKVGEFVQRIARSGTAVYRIDVVCAPMAYGPENRRTAWSYDVTEVYGANVGDDYNAVISTDEYQTVSDPDTWPTLTTQQRQIYDAAALLLHFLERNVPDNTVHWLNESLKIDLERLTNQDNASSKVYARRTAFVGNWPTRDTQKETQS